MFSAKRIESCSDHYVRKFKRYKTAFQSDPS